MELEYVNAPSWQKWILNRCWEKYGKTSAGHFILRCLTCNRRVSVNELTTGKKCCGNRYSPAKLRLWEEVMYVLRAIL